MPSALSDALARIGDRWSLLLVEALMDAPLRFADLQDAVNGISTNILTARLRHLESEGVVLAAPYSERPLRYSYELTDAGRDLAGAVRMLSQWGADHIGGRVAPDPARTGPDAASTGHGGGAGAVDAIPTGRRPASGPEGGTPAHQLCGTPLAAVWWCPTCEVPAGADAGDAVWV